MSNRILLFTVLVLTFLKFTSLAFTNFDLFGDEAQYWVWSKSPDFGYFSKPPFLAWFIGIYTSIFGNFFFVLKLLPLTVYFFTAFAIYNLSKNLGLKHAEAFSCSLVFLFIPAVSFSTFFISTDVFLLLFWTLSLNQLLRIKKNQNIGGFILLGIFIGMAFLSKYAAVYFVICLFVYILVDKSFRTFFLTHYFKFALTIICSLVILLPNIIWNINNDWVTLQHTADNTNLGNLNLNLFRGLEFLTIQILMLGPFLFIGAMINLKNLFHSDNQKFLLIFSIPIFLIVLIEAILVRANANWAAPALISFFIFLYIGIKNGILIKANLLFNFSFAVLFFILIATSYPLKIFNRINGLSEFAEETYSQTNKKDLKDIVISDRLLFSSMKYQLRNMDLVFHMPHEKKSNITNHFKITNPLDKNMKKNFIYIGNPKDINYLENDYFLNKIDDKNYLFSNQKLLVYEVIFN